MKDKMEEKENIIKKEKNINFNLIEVVIIILMTALVVGVGTGIILYNNLDKRLPSNLSYNKDYMEELENAYYNILNEYVEKVDEKKLVNAAIKGMYGYLGDPYTSYLDEDSSGDLQDRLNGYKGIGVEITKVDGGILVATVFKDGPAALAGLEAGDIITKINKKDMTNATAADAQGIIKNSKLEKIEIEFLRAGITKTTEINIEEVYVPSIEKSKFDEIGYIQIKSFGSKTSEQFKTALEELEGEGITSLLIDVRDNGGGYLNSAVEIAELFIEKGKNIYGLKSKNNTTFYPDKTKASRNYKVGILMNNNSASASEILTSALKESYGATLLGTQSYGKGTVQETSELSSGGMIKFTTAYWLTPNGNKIDGIGIKPDIEIKGKYAEGLPFEEDEQLKEALNALK